MKSQLFKTAWKLKKEMNYSLSDALKLVWKAFKNNAKVIINTSWNKIKSIAFTSTVGESTYTRGNFDLLMQDIINHLEFNNNGAKACYDGKTFNND